MRVGKLEPYTEEQTREHQLALVSETPSATIFNLVSAPFFIVGQDSPRIGGDKARPKKLKKIKRILAGAMEEKIGEHTTQRALRKAGAELVFEDEDFKVFNAVWEEYRAMLPTALADDADAVDDWIDNFAAFTAEEWKAEVERRTKAALPAAPVPAEVTA